TKRPIAAQLADEPGNFLQILFDHQHSRALQRGWNSAGAERHHRQIEHHRFDDRDAEALVLTHADEDIGSAIPSVEILAGNLASEEHVSFEPTLLNQAEQ